MEIQRFDRLYGGKDPTKGSNILIALWSTTISHRDPALWSPLWVTMISHRGHALWPLLQARSISLRDTKFWSSLWASSTPQRDPKFWSPLCAVMISRRDLALWSPLWAIFSQLVDFLQKGNKSKHKFTKIIKRDVSLKTVVLWKAREENSAPHKINSIYNRERCNTRL